MDSLAFQPLTATSDFDAPAGPTPLTIDLEGSSDSSGLESRGVDSSSLKEDTFEYRAIDRVPGEPYRILQPIPVKIERMGDADFLATFVAGNIGISGSTRTDAFQALLAEILDTFDLLTAEESALSPAAAKQLQILRNYIGEA